MKRYFLLAIICSSLIACNSKTEKGIESNNMFELEGIVKNSDLEYISLNYMPRLRGNLNFDGFKSIGTYIDSTGMFNLNSDKITDGANYSLEFNKNAIQLVLFKGDNIRLNFDIKNPSNSLFAQGNGAGKINILRLNQFDYDNFEFEKYSNIDKFSLHIDSIISNQLDLLKSIYLKKQYDTIITQASNKVEIQKIIHDSPLSENEYNFVSNRINFQRYTLQTSFLSKLSGNQNVESKEINFNSSVFKHFNNKEYTKLYDINDWQIANSLESILQIEYLRKLELQKNTIVNYGNWQSFYNNSDYENWRATFLKENFNDEIYNKYFADYSAWFMSLGFDYKNLIEKLDTNNIRYAKRLNEFEYLLDNGLNNEEYALDNTSLNLDESKFESVLNKFKGKSLFIVFWSAQFAGASIVKNLPSIKYFEKNNKELFDVIYICIDKELNKKVWAARIIDNDWKSDHYFLPIEGNDSVLNKFSDKKISAFCDGGATFAFIGKDGIINNAIDYPFHLTQNEIEKMIN